MRNLAKALALIATGAVTTLLYVTWQTEPTVPPAQVKNAPEPADPRIDELLARIDTIEEKLSNLEPVSITHIQQQEAFDELELDEADIQYTQPDTPLSMQDGLIAAGLDQYTAENIARAMSDIELRRLDLRDQARRQGQSDSEQLHQQLTDLKNEEVDLQVAVGEDIYDRYLFHTGKPNRLEVKSVILGSTAEQIGLESGDRLLSYEGDRVYSWGDLWSATSGGERGESVTMTVQRGENQLSFSLPRGPLGVRLDRVRVNPDDS